MSFEENLAQLAEIVENLENGNLPLEKSVELYEKGLKISAECKKELESCPQNLKSQNADTLKGEYFYERYCK